jgi:hypothetical protein
MKEHFTQNSMKPRMMTDAFNSAIPGLTKPGEVVALFQLK